MKDLDAQDAISHAQLTHAKDLAKERIPATDDVPTNLAFLRGFTAPISNQLAARYIRQTLGLKAGETLKSYHVRRAVYSALLTPLRQNIGSCFATAPAILIQGFQQGRLIDDLFQLMMTGRLKRVIDGKEFTVPLSPTTGLGGAHRRVQATYLTKLKLLGKFDHGEELRSVREWIQIALCQEMGLEADDIDPQHTETLLQRPGPKGLQIRKFFEKEAEVLAKYQALTEHPLLKAWEYTLASLSDFKIEFFRWNLYTSLGFDQEEKGGIGEVIYQYIEERLEESHRERKKHQEEYVVAQRQVKMTEALIARAETPEDARRRRAELAANLTHLYNVREMRDDSFNLEEKYSKFYRFLVRSYAVYLEEHFQEVFDPEMIVHDGSQFDDAPAGFRLLYKHGRADPSQWTYIHSEREFQDALFSFFRLTEPQILDDCGWKRGKKELERVTTLIFNHVQTEEFMKSATERISKMYKQKRTPWSYASGGTMETLVKCYYAEENPIELEERWVDSATDLLTFLIDTMKGLSGHVQDLYLENPDMGMLMYSPTHAFLLKPGLFKEGWLDKGFTYTWIRDNIIRPSEMHYAQIRLSGDDQIAFLQTLSDAIPPLGGMVRLDEWRNYLIAHLPSEQVDSALFAAYGVENPLIFGDTNWPYYHFGLIVSPGTYEFELWRMQIGGKTGLPMRNWNSFYDGTVKKPWGIFTNPSQYGA